MSHPGSPRSPKADADTKTAFRRLVPDDERVTVRPMFGSLAAFANGYMFMGLFGTELFVRLSEPDRQARLDAGWRGLEVMPGRTMGDYLVVPGDWRADSEEARDLGERALAFVTGLPPKKK